MKPAGAGGVQYVMETYGKEDMYPSEFVVSDEHGHSCVVITEVAISSYD